MVDDNQKVIDYRARFVQSISVLVGLPVDTEDLMDQALSLGDDPIIGASVISLLDEYDKVNKIAQFDAQELEAIKTAINILRNPVMAETKVEEEHIEEPANSKEEYTAPEISVEEKSIEEPAKEVENEHKEEEKVEQSTDSFPACEIPHGFHEMDSEKWELKGRYAISTDGRLFNLGTGKYTGSAVPTDGGFVLEIEGKKLRFSDIISEIFGVEKKNDVPGDTTSESTTAAVDAATEPEQTATETVEERFEEEEREPEPVMITWIKGINPNKYKLFPDGRVYNYVTGKSLIQSKGLVNLSSTMCSTGERTGAINHINKYKVSDLLEHAYGKKK
jgi:hypothetical protein